MFDKKSLISHKYKKNSPAKYALLLYLASSIRSVSIMFDIEKTDIPNIPSIPMMDISYFLLPFLV